MGKKDRNRLKSFCLDNELSFTFSKVVLMIKFQYLNAVEMTSNMRSDIIQG